MADNILITSSNMIAFWRLVRVLLRHRPITVEAAIQTSRDSGLIGGSLPVNDGFKLGLYCKLLHIDGNKSLLPTAYCEEKVVPLCIDDEPNVQVTRAILLKYMSLENFHWLLSFDEDPEVFKTGVPDEWIALLENSGLFDFEDVEVRAWWSEVFDRFETYQEGKKVEQGTVAEKLTFEWEKNRLTADGYDHSSIFVKWASQISSKYGYDILSIRGNLLLSDYRAKDKVSIEVKCTASNSTSEFRFFVSRNEWKAASDNLHCYYFYCWVDTNLHTKKAEGPYIIPASILAPHVPLDNSAACSWSECRFILDLNSMKINDLS